MFVPVLPGVGKAELVAVLLWLRRRGECRLVKLIQVWDSVMVGVPSCAAVPEGGKGICCLSPGEALM